MGIQSTTAKDAELTAKRAAFVGRHRLRDYKLSGRHLMKMVLAATIAWAAAAAVESQGKTRVGDDPHFSPSPRPCDDGARGGRPPRSGDRDGQADPQ